VHLRPGANDHEFFTKIACWEALGLEDLVQVNSLKGIRRAIVIKPTGFEPVR